jgi:hypothetical protein
LPIEGRAHKGTNAGTRGISIDTWMELFYASLLDHDPAKLAQRLKVVRLHGQSRKLHRVASHSERQMLRAVLKAIEHLERLQPLREGDQAA